MLGERSSCGKISTRLKKSKSKTTSRRPVVVPANQLRNIHPDLKQSSYKFVVNCEHRLFQRPDEAIVRGYDKTAERDFSLPGNFFANYEPLSRETAKAMIADTILFGQFSEPIQEVITDFVEKWRLRLLRFNIASASG